MSFFSNAHETSERYGSYITEFEKLFRKHQMSFGTPEHFFQLAPKLAYDESFRMDFSWLTKSVAQREEGRLTLTRILTIIAIAMGGMGIEDLGTASAVPISLVVVFLAGVGGWSETEPPVEVVSQSPETKEEVIPQPVVDTAVVKAAKNEEKEALELEKKLSVGKNDIEELTSSLFGGPAMMKEALSRLEINTLALKLHLDSIDSRMERIEPHLDDLSARLVPPGDVNLPPKEEEPKVSLPARRYSAVGPEATTVPEPSREFSAWYPMLPPKPKEDGPSSEQMRGMVAVLGVLLLALAIAAVLFLYANRSWQLRALQRASPTAAAKVEAARESVAVSVQGEEIPGATGSEAVGEKKTQPPVKQALASQQGVAARTPAKAVRDEQGNDDNPRIVEQAGVPGKIHAPKANDEPPLLVATGPVFHIGGGLPSGVATGTGVRPAVSVAGLKPPIAAGGGRPSAGSADVPNSLGPRTAPLKMGVPKDPVFVSSDVLGHNVISAPKPSYPSSSRFQHEEGNVILQALISENGTVENVSVVRGPAGLRSSAVAALRNWRYKPYLVNGEPVKVRTYVNFHFSMNQ